MSAALERCPRCPAVPMLARTNHDGRVYLECPECWGIEAVERRADPFPTVITRTKYPDGRTRLLRSKKKPGFGPRNAH